MTNFKLNRIISLILTICLIVTGIMPTNVFASTNDKGGPGYYSPPGGSSWVGSGNSVVNTKGGWRFSLLFLSGDAGGADLIDSVGNVNIDEWESHNKEVQVVGSLDVYYPGYDSRENKSYGDASPKGNGKSSFFMFDVKGINRKLNTLSGSERNMASSSELGLSDLPWKYNVEIGSASSISEILVKQVEGEVVNIELYPNNPKGQRVVEGYKYKLTEDCAKIIDKLCEQSGLSGDDIVYCETARGENGDKKNVFEQGTFNGKNGSYRLMIEPYEIVKPAAGGSWAMTLRDCIWYDRNIRGNLRHDTGHYLSLMTKFAYMPHKDILGINSTFEYEDGKILEEYTNQLQPLDLDNMGSARAKFESIEDMIANKMGYGIASISSEMCKTTPHPMYIGAVSNLFLPFAYDGTNKEAVAYSVEYAGEKYDISQDDEILTKTAQALIQAAKDAKEPSGLSGTKEKLVSQCTIDSADYNALTDAIAEQLEKGYPPSKYSSQVKALATDVIKGNNFKEFIKAVYYSNMITSETDASGNVLNTPLLDWTRVLVLQTMIDNNVSNDDIGSTALSIKAEDLADNVTYKKLGIKLLAEDKQADLEKAISGKSDYKSAYKAVASSDNTLFGENRVSGDEELSQIFSSNT